MYTISSGRTGPVLGPFEYNNRANQT